MFSFWFLFTTLPALVLFTYFEKLCLNPYVEFSHKRLNESGVADTDT